ncbi:MAG: helix-turn-helix domain-containing protein [Hespellia sp.]|nr:helix-turn-helix domain-containing protein [Hespellia sp.]
MPYVTNKKLYYQQFLRQENRSRHHRYDEELKIYTQIKNGELDQVENIIQLFTSNLTGHLSDNPVRNYKFLFVASITLTTRFCIEGNMDEEEAYTSSDLYIQKLDGCKNVSDVIELYRDMIYYFTGRMKDVKKRKITSKPIVLCMDYIYYHLHEKITITDLATYLKLSSNYLCILFKKETGQTISEYITAQRMEAAKNMLLYSDLSYVEIASTLSFSTQSYFNQVFKKFYGMTPQKFRYKNYRNGSTDE